MEHDVIQGNSMRAKTHENVVFHENSMQYSTWNPMESKTEASILQDRQ